MLIFLITLFLFVVVLLIKNKRFRSFSPVLFLPTLFWVVGSGTYSGEESKMNISIFFVTIFGVISDIVNFKIYNINFLVEFYSILFAVLLMITINGNAMKNYKNKLSRYFYNFYKCNICMLFTFFVFAFSIYKCLVSAKQDIMINSRYFLVEGIYRKNDWNFFDSLPRLFTENAYREDIVFYSFLYIILFYTLVFIFFKNKKRMKSNLIGVAFVLFFPIVSIGNNLYNYKDESAKESRAIVFYPLSHAFNVTVLGMYQDYKLEQKFNQQRTDENSSFHSQYKSLSKIKFYTLFQIIAVLMLLPPNLIFKDNYETI